MFLPSSKTTSSNNEAPTGRGSVLKVFPLQLSEVNACTLAAKTLTFISRHQMKRLKVLHRRFLEPSPFRGIVPFRSRNVSGIFHLPAVIPCPSQGITASPASGSWIRVSVGRGEAPDSTKLSHWLLQGTGHATPPRPGQLCWWGLCEWWVVQAHSV